MSHLVIPGQVIAVTRTNDDNNHEESSFLRGHGTYLERTTADGSNDGEEERLVAAVTGTVHRVNKLISVASVSDTVYHGQVGDLVVGRITAVTSTRWKVQLLPGGAGAGGGYGLSALLPLSGVHLPGGVQRVRTAQDAREMRNYLQEGDLVSAEVHKVQNDNGGSLQLHTRSFRYGKLENGCILYVPPGRVPRRKNHYTTILNGQFQVLLGCNGGIWMQRNTTPNQQDDEVDNGSNAHAGQVDLAELQEERRARHAATPYTPSERINLARLRNAVECLRLTHAQVTVESIENVYQASLSLNGGLCPSEMLHADQVLLLTAVCRRDDSYSSSSRH
jgi:exosome complex component RRP4